MPSILKATAIAYAGLALLPPFARFHPQPGAPSIGGANADTATFQAQGLDPSLPKGSNAVSRVTIQKEGEDHAY